MVEIKLELIEDGIAPAQATEGSAGFDLYSRAEHLLPPGERILVGAGFKLELPAGWMAEVRSRSGLALKHGVHVLNSPGTIDPDYRGEVGVILHNAGTLPFHIKRGERIAQMVFTPFGVPRFIIGTLLTPSSRGEGGFGHSGM